MVKMVAAWLYLYAFFPHNVLICIDHNNLLIRPLLSTALLEVLVLSEIGTWIAWYRASKVNQDFGCSGTFTLFVISPATGL